MPSTISLPGLSFTCPLISKKLRGPFCDSPLVKYTVRTEMGRSQGWIRTFIFIRENCSAFNWRVSPLHWCRCKGSWHKRHDPHFHMQGHRSRGHDFCGSGPWLGNCEPKNFVNPPHFVAFQLVYVARHPKDVCISYFYFNRILYTQEHHELGSDLERWGNMFINDQG